MGPMVEQSNSGVLKKILIIFGVVSIFFLEVIFSYVINKKVVVPTYLAKQQLQAEESEKPDIESESRTGADAAEKRSESPSELNQNIYMLGDIIINPAGSNGIRYVAMSIGLGVTDSKALDELKNREIQIRDAINLLLSQKTLGKFIDIKERGELKKEILTAINEKMANYQVKSIYFTEYVIQ